MHSFFLGAIGFFSLLIHDLSQIWHKNRLTRLFSIIGYTSVSAAIIFLILSTPAAAIGKLKFYTGIGLSLLFGFLLIYSLFIELSYKAGFSRPAERKVVSTGTYKLVRHPAFLWFTAFVLSLNLIFMSLSFFAISMSLVLMNFILVIIEDRYIFPSLFNDYNLYKKEVPFLWPRIGAGGRSGKGTS